MRLLIRPMNVLGKHRVLDRTCIRHKRLGQRCLVQLRCAADASVGAYVLAELVTIECNNLNVDVQRYPMTKLTTSNITRFMAIF